MRESALGVRFHGGVQERDGSRGRRAVKKGEVILRSTPFAHVIDSPFLAMYCDSCIVSSKDTLLRPCPECRVVWYCGDKCREEGHAWHRLECPALKRRQHNLPPNYVRLLARVILRLRNGGDKIVEKFTEREGRRFRDLMSHYSDIKTSEGELKDAEYLRNELGKLIGERLLPNMTDFLGIYGRCFICYLDPVKTTAMRRQELYRKWFFCCECKTCNSKEKRRFENSIVCENSTCLAPVSLPDIDAPTEAALRKKQQKRQQEAMMNGKEKEEKKKETEKEKQALEQNGVEEKRTSLQERGRKKEKEVEDEEAREGEDDERGSGKALCSQCGHQVSEARRKQYWDTVAFTREKLKNMTEEEPDMESCFAMIEQQNGLFSHMNAWRVRTLDFAFNGAMFQGCWSIALKYGEENHDGMRFYYGPDSPVYGLFLYKMGKGKIYFKEFRTGVRLLEEAEEKLCAGMGDSHPILEDVRLVNLMANEDVEICLERRIAKAKKREEERLQQVAQQPDNFAAHKTFPWTSCANYDKIIKSTKPVVSQEDKFKTKSILRPSQIA
ncbi:N-lysine methyltransferase SMYD2-A-like isoform X2 [Portunus trituberculatus]|uniref:N-lysine methyltransferase SMYD2-A-like isoform X2 n=1 Tax=Portunus trituberculatus TaxID=210409 RepID=UPI001E1CB3F6|nr:N-lysine methyltransferase SMYD2-A-like isoform X2 [Portunus trituberculatus]